MIAMSRISRLAGPALWLGLARPAFAQIPAWVPPEPPAAATEPLVTPALRAPRAAPVETPAPAKTALITEQHGAPPPGSEAREEPAPPAPPHPQWYGWQTLAADAALFLELDLDFLVRHSKAPHYSAFNFQFCGTANGSSLPQDCWRRSGPCSLAHI